MCFVEILKGCFSFHVKIHNDVNATKKQVLSDESSTLDPLGLITPVIITVNIFM